MKIKLMIYEIFGCKSKDKIYNYFKEGKERLEEEFDILRMLKLLRKLDPKKKLDIELPSTPSTKIALKTKPLN